MDEIAKEALEKMNKSVEALKSSFATLRTGRASAAMLDKIECDYYGDKILITQISSIASPEPRQLVIKPYDKGDIKSIASGIGASDLGINPIIDGDIIRLIVPALTEERRKEFVKKAKSLAEEAKISIRNVRREYFDFVKDDEYTEDLRKRIETDIQKVTDDSIKKIDESFLEKEKEIMTI